MLEIVLEVHLDFNATLLENKAQGYTTWNAYGKLAKDSESTPSPLPAGLLV